MHTLTIPKKLSISKVVKTSFFKYNITKDIERFINIDTMDAINSQDNQIITDELKLPSSNHENTTTVEGLEDLNSDNIRANVNKYDNINDKNIISQNKESDMIQIEKAITEKEENINSNKENDANIIEANIEKVLTEKQDNINTNTENDLNPIEHITDNAITEKALFAKENNNNSIADVNNEKDNITCRDITVCMLK